MTMSPPYSSKNLHKHKGFSHVAVSCSMLNLSTLYRISNAGSSGNIKQYYCHNSKRASLAWNFISYTLLLCKAFNIRIN